MLSIRDTPRTRKACKKDSDAQQIALKYNIHVLSRFHQVSAEEIFFKGHRNIASV